MKKFSLNYLVLFSLIFFLYTSTLIIKKSPSYASSSFDVGVVSQIELGCQCLQVCVYNLEFGPYDYINGNYVTTDINVEAPEDHPYVITLDKGQHKNHSVFQGRSRAMVGGTEDFHLGYFVYVVNRCHDDDEWGDSGFGNTYMALPASDWGTGAGQPHTVYGWLPPGQSVPPGAYCDVVMVTVHP